MTCDRFRFHHYSSGSLASSLLADKLKQPTRFPFWGLCISPFHHFMDNGAYDDSLALTMPVSPWLLTPLWLRVLSLSCPSIDRFHYLPAARAESMTLLRGDKAW